MRACHVRRQHPVLSYSLSRGSLERQSTRSLAEALGRMNRLAVGAGQTPTRFLLFCTPTPASCSLLSRTSFVHAFLLSENVSLSSSERPSFAFSSPNVSPHRTCFYIFGASLRGAVHPKLTPPHWGMVTMTTRALSKKAGVGTRERMLLRKNEGGLQSS